MRPILHFLKSQYSQRSIDAVLELLSEGCSVPFIARYRKEKTNSLDEVAIQDIAKAQASLENHLSRQKTILDAIQEQNALSDGLKARILSCFDTQKLEDLYLPYKKRKKSRADVARENGLEGLAKIVMSQQQRSPREAAGRFTGKNVPTVEEALEGARHIIADWINTDTQIREKLRERFVKFGFVESRIKRGKKEEGQKFSNYFDHTEKLDRCPSHRYLAILRGEREGFLNVHILPDEDKTIAWLERQQNIRSSPSRQLLEESVRDAYKRLLFPSIENQIKQEYKKKADAEAIEVFANNLEQLLMAPPLGEKALIAIDPGFRTGCKLVALDENGTLLSNDTIFPHAPQNEKDKSLAVIRKYLERYGAESVAIGDGTAGRETLQWLKSAHLGTIDLFLVNESGASIYSASEIARQEFPDKDITVRGAVSIGRRLMDPLAELIKIDPKSIGVGQYQHDVNAKMLSERLDEVVISCVNRVGVNLNTASAKLLSYVSGLGAVLAENVVAHRRQNGPFDTRTELKKVKRLGPKAFEQASGFLRIRNGSNPLDNTGVHPERYALVRSMCQTMNVSLKEVMSNPGLLNKLKAETFMDRDVGLPTILDIKKELEKPGLDIRGEVQNIQFRDDVRDFDDLTEGMVLRGVVKNITNFGAFVDIGIKESGLVHISEISNTFIKHPGEKLRLNQAVQVMVIGIDPNSRRIQLSIKQIAAAS